MEFHEHQGVILEDLSVNCTIYAPIATITLGFIYLESSSTNFCEQRYVSRINIFEALWIEEDSKSGPRTPNMDKPWPVPWARRFQEGDAEGASKNDRGTGRHGLSTMVPTVCSELCHPESTCFLHYCLFSKRS